MKIGLVGLGRMGAGISERLRRAGHEVVGYDQNPAISQVKSLEELNRALPQPRVVWVMVPAGGPTQATVEELAESMTVGDVIIDGGNSYYKDSMKRASALKQKGIFFVDVGTSGGIWGLAEGFSLMAGGEPEAYKRIEPLLQALAPSTTSGYGHIGPSGSGHFVKMVHNGIEYGLMQAYAEGFELMEAKKEFQIDLHQVAGIWRQGSVVRSWLLDLAERALEEDPKLAGLQAFVDDSGEGRWTVQESIELAVPTPAISAALQMRFRSRQEQPFGARLLAALRNQFGGHAVHKR
ncbi:MAG TPA: decarboxylating 6-phosphogluconate dehydrogenase [Dehalococcoidia bacterium]|jgi:6-phosphogluconate dehydrogenase|nr:decarboxylating 6-phosphogluconate dehydrogenase [Dehalococcoidia bacterium]